MPRAGDRAEWAAESLENARVRWVGENPLEVAHWLAQLAHESGQLRYTRELATGDAYEGRANLGNTQPGDGRRFRGRGFIQLTGRGNYSEYAAASGHNVVAQPDLLEDVALAADVSGWFWSARRVWERTEGTEDRVRAITKIINGGTNGLDERRAFFERARLAMGDPAEMPAPTDRPTAAAPIEHHDFPADPPAQPDAAMRGESPDYGGPSPMIPILPLLSAVLPSLIRNLPELGKIFGSGSEVSERNIAAGTKVLEVITAATGAVNAVDAAEKIAADPQARQAAASAIQSHWFELVEAGGGGIAGARKADLDGQAAGWVWYRSGVFLMGLLLLPLVYAAAAAVLFPAVGGDWPTEVRASALMLILGLATVVSAYWFGASNKPNTPSK